MKARTQENISEIAFASQVESLLNLFGWLWCHFRPARSNKGWRTPLAGHKGLPDYVAVRDGVLLFAELKDRYGKPSREQQEWIDALKAAGQQVYLWRPGDIDEVTEILRGNN